VGIDKGKEKETNMLIHINTNCKVPLLDHSKWRLCL